LRPGSRNKWVSVRNFVRPLVSSLRNSAVLGVSVLKLDVTTGKPQSRGGPQSYAEKKSGQYSPCVCYTYSTSAQSGFARKVLAGLRSRRKHKAWGVSPRSTYKEPIEPVTRATAATFSGFRPLSRALDLDALATWGWRPRLHSSACFAGYTACFAGKRWFDLVWCP
jgi:hypothetical protein